MTTNKKPQVIHKTDYLLRPKSECGITIRHSIKSQEAWKFVTCKKCLRMRRDDGRGMEAGNMKPKHRLADGHLTLWLVELINSATNEKINWLGVKRAQTILYALHHSGFHIYPKDDKHEARAIRWLRAKGYVIGKRIE